MLLIDPDRKPAATAETLQSLYGLTPAEGRLTEMLLTGRELAECAEMLGNTIETARVRLKRIMRKTNVSRQSELIRLLVGFPDLRLGANPQQHDLSRHTRPGRSHLGEK